LSEPDEDSFGAPDVAEPIRVFVLGHFADEFRAAFTETCELKAKFGKTLNGGIDVFNHDTDVVHTLDCHDASSVPNLL
jgi:hypothetical protein